MEQGKIMEAEAPTVRVGATPTGLTAPPHNPQGFLQVGCPSCRPNNSVKALKACYSTRQEELEKTGVSFRGFRLSAVKM